MTAWTTPTKQRAGLDTAREAAIGRLRAEIGAEYVFVNQQPLDSYHDPFPIGAREEFAPGLAVQPGSVEEVQAVLRIANEHSLPLWTVSQGHNNAYGGAGPRVAGTAVLDLKRMNRILDIDDVNGSVLLEPGVRFFDLYDALVEGGYDWWCSVPDLAWGSVMGNAMDRGFGYTQFGVHNEAVCGMEVVLPDGNVVRTGMGAMTGSKTWQVYKPGFGPSVDGLFAQSNYGVVTKMGSWLMPRPEAWAAVDITVPKFEDLAVLVDTIRPLKFDGTIQSSVAIADVLSHVSFMGARDQFYDGPGAVPDDVIAGIATTYGLGQWTCHFAVYDREERLAGRLQIVEDAFGRIPGSSIHTTTYRGDTPAAEVAPPHRPFGGIAGMNAAALPDWWGPGGGHIGLSPVSPVKGEDAMRQVSITRRRFQEYGLDFMAAFTAANRHMAHVLLLTFDHRNLEQMARVRQMFSVIIQVLAAEGYGEYRAHPGFMDLIAGVNDFNGNALLRLQEKLKDALDPNGILSPGKSGIWPAALRD